MTDEHMDIEWQSNQNYNKWKPCPIHSDDQPNNGFIAQLSIVMRKFIIIIVIARKLV